MVVRFDNKENMSTGDNHITTTQTRCKCNTNYQLAVTSSATTTTTTASQTTANLNNGSNTNIQNSGFLREIVENCKEMRIEHNTNNLRIVGNNNRIRISLNVSDIIIVGNNTRLKIKTNHGHIEYIGNNGRISLGKDSTEQIVDYSGCNGVLKVQSSKKCGQRNDDNTKNNNAKGNTGQKTKEIYASYNGSPSDSEVCKCHRDYNNVFNHKKSTAKVTKTTTPLYCENVFGNSGHQLPTTIVHNFGNIVIANSSNICISPYT